MKAARVVPIAIVIVVLLLGISLPGCSLFGTTTTSAGESTTTTVEGEQTPADIAIAAITKSAAITAPQTIKSGSLVAGSDAAFPPLIFADDDDRYQGFDFDLCTAIAKKLGLQFEIVQVDFRDLISGLTDDGLYDMVAAALVITPELQADMSFTDPHLPAALAITTPAGAPLVDAAALSGKRVGVQEDTMADDEVAKVSGIDLERYDRVLDAFADMEEGKLDAVVIEQLVSSYLLDTFEEFRAKFANTGSIPLSSGYGYGFKTDNTALLTAVNAAIAELRSDGVYSLICEKWGITGN